MTLIIDDFAKLGTADVQQAAKLPELPEGQDLIHMGVYTPYTDANEHDIARPANEFMLCHIVIPPSRGYEGDQVSRSKIYTAAWRPVRFHSKRDTDELKKKHAGDPAALQVELHNRGLFSLNGRLELVERYSCDTCGKEAFHPNQGAADKAGCKAKACGGKLVWDKEYTPGLRSMLPEAIAARPEKAPVDVSPVLPRPFALLPEGHAGGQCFVPGRDDISGQRIVDKAAEKQCTVLTWKQVTDIRVMPRYVTLEARNKWAWGAETSQTLGGYAKLGYEIHMRRLTPAYASAKQKKRGPVKRGLSLSDD